MGTNFYIHKEACKACKREDEGIHLGKSSFGWSFALQANDFKWYKNWAEMKEWLKGKVIKNEYGEKISRKEFIEWVENRKNVKDPKTDWGSSAPVIIDGYKFFNYEFS